MSEFKEHIEVFPTYQGKDMTFYDVGSLFKKPEAFRRAIREMGEPVRGGDATTLVGLEARGFAFSSPMSLDLGLGWVMMRKQGKLPGDVASSAAYVKEYGSGNDVFEIQPDRFEEGDLIELVDDVIATGGTTREAILTLEKYTPARVIGVRAFINLAYLPGAKSIEDEFGIPVSSVVTYEEDPLAHVRAA